MEEAARWVREQAGDHKAVLVAYPVAFDWSFLYWYFERFAASGSPFGFSSCLDIRTLYQAAAGTVHAESGQSAMPASLLPVSPHTHNALDDAIEQGQAVRQRVRVGRPATAPLSARPAQRRLAGPGLARQPSRQRKLSRAISRALAPQRRRRASPARVSGELLAS